ncbi:hypothetical protein [Pelagibius sp.]|uniref:hypothetical protein n=1 Tax=Pelagibius sp. TaxID=1931238 RepID=UPI00260949D8|nr:hypothetical protein [Pelagibius sp.]
MTSVDHAASGGFLTRCGQVAFSGERTLWLHGARRQDFEAARPLVEGLRDRFARLDFLFTAADPGLRGWLTETFPGAVVLPPPFRLGYCASRYLVNLNVRGLLLLGPFDPRDRFISTAAHGRATPVVVMQSDGVDDAERPTDLEALGSDLPKLQHCFVAGEARQRYLTSAGLPAERVTRLSDEAEARRDQLLTVVAPLLGRDLKLMRSTQRPLRRRLERLALACMDRPRLRRWLSVKVERFDTIEALRETLGNPTTILCLGNGPSSEGPEVAAVRHDCLFRVNHVWLERGFLTAPDMVFTGSKASLSAVKGSIFGLQTVKSEARLLATRVLQPHFRRIRYATIERFDLYLSEPRWEGIRPTNGAAMLATAVALQPPRLVISGIDLFSHPAGSYPGDTATPNAYSPGHDADSELALLLEALSLYKGELIILSDALKARWEEHQSALTARRDAAG